MQEFIIVKAKLRILTNEEGGHRTWSIKSGYRPNHVFELTDKKPYYSFIGDIVFNENESISPGEEKTVLVRFITNPSIEEYIQVGRKWHIYEIPHLIGEAEILEITNN